MASANTQFRQREKNKKRTNEKDRLLNIPGKLLGSGENPDMIVCLEQCEDGSMAIRPCQRLSENGDKYAIAISRRLRIDPGILLANILNAAYREDNALRGMRKIIAD